MAIPRNQVENKRIVLLLGDFDRDEMQPLFRWLHQLVSQSGRLIFCQDVNSLLGSPLPFEPPIYKINAPSTSVSDALKQGEFPDLIIVLQSEPDEYSAPDASLLLGFAPLARIIVCCGHWCESIGRNRDIWPISVRIPIWAATSRIEREWQFIQDPNSPNPLPWSASREELFAYDLPSIDNWFESETVAVDSPDPSYQQYLLETIRNSVVRIGQSNFSVVLFDADPWCESRAVSMKQLRYDNAQVVIVALVDQVDPMLTSELLAAGATQVVLKLGYHRQLST